MRVGNLEIPGGLLVMPAFVLVVAVLLLWTWYYYSRQTKEMQRLAASRGWTFLGKDSPELRLSLDGMKEESQQWKPENVILVSNPPDTIYLFNYQVDDPESDTLPEQGIACLAGRYQGRSADLVTIIPRSPLSGISLWRSADKAADVGGPEFRRQFLTFSSRPDVAAALIMRGVEEAVLLRRASRLKWNRVRIAGKRVLVSVAYSLKPEERDELIALTVRLRAALP